MKCANDSLSDQEFADEVFLIYTDLYRKRYNAEHAMIRKSRSSFKKGDDFASCILDTIFPKNSPDTLIREMCYRQHIESEKKMKEMEKRMQEMEKGMRELERWKQEQLSSSKKIQTLTQDKADIQEEFYDCQAVLLQQKEYVKVFQTEEVNRKRRMLQYEQKIKEVIQQSEIELKGIECTLKSLSQSPYSVFESVNRLKEKKEYLLKQKESYLELLGFLE